MLARLAGACTRADDAVATGAKPKPKAKAKAAAGGAGGASGEAQLRQQLDAANRKHAQDLQKLKGELEELRKARAAGDACAEHTAGVMDVDSESELGKAVALACDRLKKARDMPAEVRDLVAGGYDACIAKLQDELAGAQAARRAANPLNKQLEVAEAHKTRMAKKLAEARSALQAREAEREEIDKKIQSQQAVVAEAEAPVAKATAEVAALAAQYASEKTPAAAAAPVAAEPGAAPSGFVSVAFAEEKWREREDQFAQQLAQLQAMVATQTEVAGAASEEAPSVADDLASVDDLTGDDEKWNKVIPSKRKALLRRERDALAGKLRTSLGKVCTISSPFLKKS